ncbi:MAG: adenine phosphoribosyltransferase [Phycisphaerae bacterium]|nr:adenine phosphoribosyltransferase [Phycisphaerae bacterium]
MEPSVRAASGPCPTRPPRVHDILKSAPPEPNPLNTPDELKTLIRDVPDFPRPGVVFKDFTPLLRDPAALALAVELMANPFRGKGVELVVGAESRGFIFGTALAQSLSAGFVPIRKPGKLPRAKSGIDYALEYGADRLEMHDDAVHPGERVLIVDDLLATGGTMRAACELVRGLGARLLGISVLIELTFLPGRESLRAYGDVHAVLRY